MPPILIESFIFRLLYSKLPHWLCHTCISDPHVLHLTAIPNYLGLFHCSGKVRPPSASGLPWVIYHVYQYLHSPLAFLCMWFWLPVQITAGPLTPFTCES